MKKKKLNAIFITAASAMVFASCGGGVSYPSTSISGLQRILEETIVQIDQNHQYIRNGQPQRVITQLSPIDNACYFAWLYHSDPQNKAESTEVLAFIIKNKCELFPDLRFCEKVILDVQKQGGPLAQYPELPCAEIVEAFRKHESEKYLVP